MIYCVGFSASCAIPSSNTFVCKYTRTIQGWSGRQALRAAGQEATNARTMSLSCEMYGGNTADCLRERSQRFMLTTQGSNCLFASPLDALVACARVLMHRFFYRQLAWTAPLPSSSRVLVIPVIYLRMCTLQPIPVALRSKGWVCGRSLAGIAVLNPAGGIYVCLLWVSCVVR
jgi:hypothetical protein